MILVKKTLLSLLLALALLLTACAVTPPAADPVCRQHTDADNNGVCDRCYASVFVYFDFYCVNDLHGKVADGENHPGVDELTTYLRNARRTDEHMILLSAGDMWQGSSESNMTQGLLMTEWMNELGFAAMALGNHEYDWGREAIEANANAAEFPFLAINVYDRETDERADYCAPSVVVEGSGLQIGIIGAIGDCYSSIASDKCDDVYFKTGKELTALVKAEAERLRSEGVDFIVYTLHDGYGSTRAGITSVDSSDLRSYYDTSLSDGYVDLVFEGHSHQGYRLQDEYGVYHLQNRGDNKGGISHAEIAINIANGTSSVRVAELVGTNEYDDLADDPIVESLLAKYADQIADANRVVGFNTARRGGDALRQLAADLYYQAGLEKWGDSYDIVLGGGFFTVRSPGSLASGEVTYGMLQSLFPFDNELTLCSVKGRDLWSKFFATDNDNYFISYGDYGQQVRDSIDMDGTYYIIVDSYTAFYGPNRLTVVEEFGEKVYARDLLADYIESGGLS